MSHGKIHEDQQKSRRQDQTFPERRRFGIPQCFLLCRKLFGLAHSGFLFRILLGSPVPCIFNSLYDGLRRSRSFYAHAVGEQADADGCDSLNLCYRLFDSGLAGSAAHAGYCVLFQSYLRLSCMISVS